MGAFFTNYQVRGKYTAEVCKALAPMIKDLAYVSPEKGGWVTVYDFASDLQDQQTLNRIAGELSKKLKTTVFAFLVHDSDVAAYWLYQNGILEDEFNSAPDYFGGTDQKGRVGGNVEKLLTLCVTGTSRTQVEKVINPPHGFPAFAEQIFEGLSKLLGIDEARIAIGFRQFDEIEGGEERPDDASEFTMVGKHAPKKKIQPSKRAAKRRP